MHRSHISNRSLASSPLRAAAACARWRTAARMRPQLSAARRRSLRGGRTVSVAVLCVVRISVVVVVCKAGCRLTLILFEPQHRFHQTRRRPDGCVDRLLLLLDSDVANSAYVLRRALIGQVHNHSRRRCLHARRWAPLNQALHQTRPASQHGGHVCWRVRLPKCRQHLAIKRASLTAAALSKRSSSLRTCA